MEIKLKEHYVIYNRAAICCHEHFTYGLNGKVYDFKFLSSSEQQLSFIRLSTNELLHLSAANFFRRATETDIILYG